MRPLFKIRHVDTLPSSPTSTRTLARMPRVNPIGLPQAGASSAFLNLPPTYFNILYVHSPFGGLTPWAATARPR